MNRRIVFFDCEFGKADRRLHDAGAVCTDGTVYHGANVLEFQHFLQKADILCGHNILAHDLELLKPLFQTGLSSLLEKSPFGILTPFIGKHNRLKIDTLYMSALFFPQKPYHRLLKDEKFISEELCNPINDAQKCRTLFWECDEAYRSLPKPLQKIYYGLLKNTEAFGGFFEYLDVHFDDVDLVATILGTYKGKICEHADIKRLIDKHPIELAYCLALINTGDKASIFPAWVLKNFPQTEVIFKALRFTPCEEGCVYCDTNLNVKKALKRYFGFEAFRTYNGEPLQEQAAEAAVRGESLLAIFPTGGGKSLAFQ